MYIYIYIYLIHRCPSVYTSMNHKKLEKSCTKSKTLLSNYANVIRQTKRTSNSGKCRRTKVKGILQGSMRLRLISH